MLGFLNMPAKAQKNKNAKKMLPSQIQLEKMSARFAPTPLRVDTSKLLPATSKPW